MSYRNVLRRCFRCQQAKPMAGGWTAPGGRKFVCAQCRPKREATAPVPTERPAA